LKRKGAGYHHGDLRRALVDATIKLVEIHGPDGFTLRAAAKLAGVSDGAPYHHFADREALLATVAADGFSLLYDEMRAVAEQHRGTPRQKTLAMGTAYLLFAAKHPARFRLMFTSGLMAQKRHRELAESAAHAYELAREAFASGLSRAKSTPRPEGLTLAAWALLHGLSMLTIDGYIEGDKPSTKKLERIAEASLQLLLDREEGAKRDSEIPPPRSGRRARTEPARSATLARR
jgi:AcrR family transcriptional regulator